MDVDPACDGGSMEVTPAEVILSDDNFEEPECRVEHGGPTIRGATYIGLIRARSPPGSHSSITCEHAHTSGYPMESAGIEVIGIFRRV